MKFVTAALAIMCAFATLPQRAGAEPVVVVELFTSQGCSSCPPADALMVKLARRADVIGLALHVDYWDYIGWKDEFANPGHTLRQKGYAHAARRKMVYTPQMIVNGQDDVVGVHAMELADLIAKHKRVPPTVSVQVTRTGGAVVVRMQAIGDGAANLGPDSGSYLGPYDVHLVRFTPMQRAQITRGELAGRDFEYANTVDGWTVIGQWDGQAPTTLKVDIDGDRPAVVLVQRSGFGAIVAAARAD